MNERIKELAIQAGFFYEDYKDIWYLEYHNESCEEEMKKFAELIVQECAKVAYECGPAVVWGSERQFNPVTYTGNQILIHFGVEE
jgi:hypothetical protein